MMNRQQRRAAAKVNPIARLPMSQQKTIERWERNGITQADLDKAFQDGAKQAQERTTMFVIKLCYAAAAMVAHEMAGFGLRKKNGRMEGRLRKFMDRLDELVIDWASSEQAVEEVWEKTGLSMRWKCDDPFESRIVDKGA